MRILQLHCDSIDYTPTKKEIAIADESAPGTRHIEEVLVAFVTVERKDDHMVANKAAHEIIEHMEKIGCSRVLIYPYAHLSANLASPSLALDVIFHLENLFGDIEVSRAPFGWTKSYNIKIKGHPLAESSRVITSGEEEDAPSALKDEARIVSQWRILSPDGTMKDISKFDFGGHENLEILAKYERSKKRAVDEPPPHVVLMKRLGIADYEPASDSGNIRFYPNGRLIKSLIERYVTERVREYGGYEVETPVMYDTHHPSMESYFNRFPARQYSVDSEGKSLFLRFAACFGQFLMASDFQASYRNMPYRLYELTRYSFRREQSGELVGLRRLRAFTMPDCHAFCKDMQQAVKELQVRFRLSRDVLSNLGIDGGDYEMAVRFTREFYDGNRDMINQLVREHGRPVLVEIWKERFFYFVLKWEFNYIDGAGKASAMSTDQIDVENGSRYGIEFVDENNTTQNPIILHNSPSGAVERIIQTLLEKASDDTRRGKKPSLPLWLAPTQVRIIPVAEEYRELGIGLAESITGRGVRADVDDRNESIGKRIRSAEREWIRYVLVVGKKEADSGVYSVRDRETKNTYASSIEDIVGRIKDQTAGKPTAGLNMPMLLSRRPQIMA